MLHNPRPADADTHDLLSLAHAMEGSRHERIVARRIRKHHELRTANSLPIPGQLRRALDDLAHLPHAVHIDTGLGRAKIDRRADELRRRQCLRNGIDQRMIASRIALFNKCREAANEIDADLPGSPVHGLSYRHIGVRLAGLSRNRNRRDRYAFMDDRNTVFSLNVLARFDQELG